MEDQEILELKNLKHKLFMKACNLVENLKREERNLTEECMTESLRIPENNKSAEYEMKLRDASRGVSGITFQNVEKKWLHHDVYYYSAQIALKNIQIFVELNVNLKDFQDFEICNIKCNFTNVDECLLLETQPWILQIANTNNFSLLTSSLAQYSKQHSIRSQCLNLMKENDYGIIEKCTNENGGFLILVQSPKSKRVYLNFQWVLTFLQKRWCVRNYFFIAPTEIGTEFAEKNKRLLKKFCKVNIRKKDLFNLWNELFAAVVDYEAT